MKRFPYTTLLSVILGVVSSVLIFSGYSIYFSLIGIAAFFLIEADLKKFASPLQLVLSPTLWILFGVSLDYYFKSFPWFTVTLFFLAFSCIGRLILFKKIYYSRARWLDPGFFIIGLLLFITTAFRVNSDWMAWVFPLPAVLVSAFAGIAGYFDTRYFSRSGNHRFGVETGKAAPDFVLPDSNGNPVSLSGFSDKRHVLLLFVRGDWCPTCHIMLRTYQREKHRFAEKDIMVVAVGPDPVGINKKMVENLGLDYSLLSDENMEVSKMFGIKFQANNPTTKYTEGIPMPASFLIDKKGIVRFTSHPGRAGEFLSPDRIFPVLQSLN